MNQIELCERITKLDEKLQKIFLKHFNEDTYDYKLVFDEYNGESVASCSYKDKQIEMHILGDLYFDDKTYDDIKLYLLRILIHERVHVFALKYNFNGNIFCDDAHNVPFGLMCLSIENKIINNTNLEYRDYDFREDEDLFDYKIPHSEIKNHKVKENMERVFFNEELKDRFKELVLMMAKNTKFKTIEELAKKCKINSERIKKEIIN